ncbi:MAG: hypothetical protein AAF902_04370 [Chloroflexota bacterium]
MIAKGNEKNPASDDVSVLGRHNRIQRMMRFFAQASIVIGVIFVLVGIQSIEIESAAAEYEQSVLETQAATLEPAIFQSTYERRELGGRSLSRTGEVEVRPTRSTSSETVALSTREVVEETVPIVKTLEAKPVLAKVEEDPEFEIEWLDEVFTISHYTFALENDPLYENDKRVKAPGLDEDELYRSGFLFGGRGVLQQGSGLAENGKYITIDWEKSYYDPADFTKNRWYFTYGIGRPVVPWETVATHHPDLPPGTRLVIETYLGQHEFVVGDAGLDLADDQIDVFIGHKTIYEADQLGITWSRVGLIRPYGYSYWQKQNALKAQEEQDESETDGTDVAADQE